MTAPHAFDRTLSDWLDDARAPEIPRRVYEGAFADARRTRQARPIPARIARRLPLSTTFDTPVATLRSRWAMLIVTGLVLLALVAAAVFAAGSMRSIDRPIELQGVFEPIGPLPGPREPGPGVTSAVALADGSVLVVAGKELARFDPATNAFRPVGSLGNERASEATVRLHDGRVLIVGGVKDNYSPPRPESYRAELYDPVTGTVARTGDTVEPRIASAATVLRDGRVLVSGGEIGGATASAEVYDPATGTFSVTGSMSRARSDHSSVLLPDGRVLVVGGAGADLDASAELYDPVTGAFTPTGPMAFPHSHFTATVLLDGRVLLAGGITGGPLPEQGHATGAAQIYDPATGRFSQVGSLVRPRTYHAAAALADGRVLVAGGLLEPGGRSNVTSNAQVFDPATGLFSPAGAMSEARFNFQAVPLAEGRVLIVGHRWLNQLLPNQYDEEARIQRSAEIFR